jgi:hypothetical protein
VPGVPGVPAAAAGPTTVIAGVNDTLCGIAAANGFVDCTPLRALPANAAFTTRALQAGDVVTVPARTEGLEPGQTEATHTFQRAGEPVAAIRFIHGSPNLPYDKDPTLRELNVSNYQTDLAGNNRTSPFVNAAVRKFDAAAHADQDTFKVEIKDLKTKKTDLDVRIEARRPTYNALNQLIGITDFPGDPNDATSERAKRGLKTQASKQGSTKTCFRSGYLRLVVDPVDKAVRPDQTILTTDMVQQGDEVVEILDQRIRAEYELDTCPAPAGQTKCKVSAEIDLCDLARQQRVKLTVHVCRAARDGAGVITVDQARQGLGRFLRGVYAQAHLGFRLIDPQIRLIQPVANLIAIADGQGRRSQGGQAIAVQVTIDGATFNAAIVTQPNVLPVTTANDLATALRAALPAGTRVVPTQNKAVAGQAIGSADVLVGDPLTQDVQVTVTTSNDARHPVTVGRVNAQLTTEFVNADMHVGTLHERALVKNYDTGSDRIDLFIISQFPAGSNTLGEAFIPFQNKTANLQTGQIMLNSAVVLDRSLTSDQNEFTVTPHELSHILLDANHANDSKELMDATVPAPIPFNGPKRISDTSSTGGAITYDNGTSGNPVRLMRTRNPGLLTGWL